MKRHELDMTDGKIWPVLLAFTVPLLLENLLQLLYNTVDSIVVGRYVGMSALAAVSATTHICGMLVRFFNGTAVGAGVVISRNFGAKNKENLRKKSKRKSNRRRNGLQRIKKILYPNTPKLILTN